MGFSCIWIIFVVAFDVDKYVFCKNVWLKNIILKMKEFCGQT